MFLVIGALILLVLGILVLVFSFLDITNTMIFWKDASGKRKRRRYDILFIIIGTSCIVLSGVLAYLYKAAGAAEAARVAAAERAAAIEDIIGIGGITESRVTKDGTTFITETYDRPGQYAMNPRIGMKIQSA